MSSSVESESSVLEVGDSVFVGTAALNSVRESAGAAAGVVSGCLFSSCLVSTSSVSATLFSTTSLSAILVSATLLLATLVSAATVCATLFSAIWLSAIWLSAVWPSASLSWRISVSVFSGTATRLLTAALAAKLLNTLLPYMLDTVRRSASW